MHSEREGDYPASIGENPHPSLSRMLHTPNDKHIPFWQFLPALFGETPSLRQFCN